jgi:hypothetical protein
MAHPNFAHTVVPVSPKRRNSDDDAAHAGGAEEATPLLSSRLRPLVVKNSNSRSTRTQVIAALVAFVVFWLLLLNGGTFTVFLPLADPASAAPHQTRPCTPHILFHSACRLYPADMRSLINFSVSPCDNFYEFACGRYMANTVIPAWAGEWGFAWDSVDNSTTHAVKDMLQVLSLPALS